MGKSRQRRKTWALLPILICLTLVASWSADEAFAAISKNQARSGVRKGNRRNKAAAFKRPAEYVEAVTQKLYSDLMSRPPRLLPSGENQMVISTPARKVPWLGELYQRNLLEASPASELLADKLIMARVLARALGDDLGKYYPKTIGLKEFLYKHKLIDSRGRMTASGEEIEQALFAEFPAGFVARPAVGVAPKETPRGLYRDGDEFIVELLRPKSALYEPAHFRTPVRSHILDAVASGEAIVLQDDLVLRADAKKKLKIKSFRELRIHTYEERVVKNAVPARWVQEATVTEPEIRAAEEFVGGMLAKLPPRLLVRQAWGVDVALFDNGEMIITDVVTNRGQRIQWSSYLEQPRVLGAYSRHLEEFAGVRFEGFAGRLIRHNLANYFPYWDARIEKAKPGVNKLLSYLPPLP